MDVRSVLVLTCVLCLLLTGCEAGEECYRITAQGGIDQFYCVSGCCGSISDAYCCLSTTIIVAAICGGFVLLLIVGAVGAWLYHKHQEKKANGVTILGGHNQGFTSGPGDAPPPYSSGAEPSPFTFMPYKEPDAEPPQNPNAAWGKEKKNKKNKGNLTNRSETSGGNRISQTPGDFESEPALPPVSNRADMKARLNNLPPLPPMTATPSTALPSRQATSVAATPRHNNNNDIMTVDELDDY